MKNGPPKTSPFEEKMDTGVIERLENVSEKSKIKRPKPKRGGCVGLAGNRVAPLRIPGGKELMQAALAGKASSFLAGKSTTSLYGGAATSLSGRPGTSLLILTKKEIPQGTVIKEADLESYLITEPLTNLDKTIIKENPVGNVAKKSFPAHSLVAAVVLAGNPSIPVSDIKLPPGGATVIRAKKKIPKGTVIQEEDLYVDVITSPVKGRDMYDSMDDLKGKVAKENIKKDDRVKKYQVK